MKGDPVKAAADLKASGLDIRLNIVGFALTNPKTQKDLAGFSQATGGLFYTAQSGDALADALLMAAVESFPYTVYDTAGKQVRPVKPAVAVTNSPRASTRSWSRPARGNSSRPASRSRWGRRRR